MRRSAAAATTTITTRRAEAVELVAQDLLPRSSLLTRLLLRRGGTMSRAEAGLLASLARAPQRITELAASESLAQPTVTQLVGRLHERGLVERGREPGDGRVVVVSVTAAGIAALDEVRAQYRGVLRDLLAERSDEEVQALAAATELLAEVVETLQQEGGS